MQIIFCSDPLEPWQPEPMYQVEVEAAQQAGLSYSLVSFEALTDLQDGTAAVRRIKAVSVPELAIYRGWMLKPEAYTLLYDALLEKNLLLINDPDQYLHCHYLPVSYPQIAEMTPRSVWLDRGPGLTLEAVTSLARVFGERPVIVKDFVKSRKHEWEEACYIPNASNPQGLEQVVSRFLELQGEDLNGGLVLREFVEFEPLGQHSKSGMPLSKEFRLFFLDARLLASAHYWEQGEYGDLTPPMEQFQAIATTIESRFFTMDVARKLDGDWLIVELGDGQVAGLPEKLDVAAFYREIARVAY
jgi:hypothetical protein